MAWLSARMGARLVRLRALSAQDSCAVMLACLLSGAALWCAPRIGLASGSASPPKLVFVDSSLMIDGGGAGRFALPLPGLRLRDKDPVGERPRVSPEGAALVAHYPSGAKVRAELSPDRDEVRFTFSDVPTTAKSFVLQMQVPSGFRLGGKYALNDGAQQPFPERATKQLLWQGRAASLALAGPSGAGFRVVVPADYQQVQDTRAIGGRGFTYVYHFVFGAQRGKSAFSVRIEPLSRPKSQAEPAAPMRPAERAPLIDRFGQSERKDFPSKVRRDAELREDLEAERSALRAQAKDVTRDPYGGLRGSGEQLALQRTGYFHVAHAAGRQLLVTPEGNAFFQLGVCGINITDDYTKVAGREGIYAWLPPKDGQFASAWRPNTPGVVSFYAANWVRKHQQPFTLERWAEGAVERIRAWGFNSAGAFSTRTESMRRVRFPVVAMLPLGKEHGVKMLPSRVGPTELMDPFAAENEGLLRTAFAKTVAKSAEDPLIIGYFLGNEQHFELLPRLLPTYKGSLSPAKRELVATLRAKYATIADFNAAWQLDPPLASFDGLSEASLEVRSETAASDMQAFHRRFLDAYYSLVRRIFREYDKNHLLIGSRMTSATANTQDVVEIAGRYLDVVSINYYTYQIEAGFLQRVHAWSGGKPLLLSEWYYGAPDQGLSGGKELDDQRQRASAYRNYVEQAAALPFVVGTQWFSFNDQSLTGRFFQGYDGEAHNTGLVNVADRPYGALVAATAQTGARIYEVMFGRQPPYAFDDPRFHGAANAQATKVVIVPRAPKGFRIAGEKSAWPGRPAETMGSGQLVLGAADSSLRGDFRLCWDASNLYLVVQVADATPLKNERRAEDLWNADAVELFIGTRALMRGGAPIFSDRQLLFAANDEPSVYIRGREAQAAQIRVQTRREVSGQGYTLQATIPWSSLDVTPHAGLELLFDVAIDNSDDGRARKQQLVWNGTARNSGDRAAWGRARLVDN